MARSNLVIGTTYTAASNGIVQFVGTSPYWMATINGISYNFQYVSGDVGRPQTTFPVLKGDTFAINCFCGWGSAFAIYSFYAVN